MKYEIVKAHYTDELEGLVNKCLSEGWELVGGVAIGDLGVDEPFVFCQAMIFKESPK